MTELLPLLAAGLVAGLIGSAHCLGMCGGLSGLFAMHESVKGLSRQLPMALAYNAGRIVSYAGLGFVVGAFGKQIASMIPLLAGPIRLLAGIMIILVGLTIAFNWRVLEPIERIGGVAWQWISPLASRFLPVTSLLRALGLGLLWGLLPCGLVYSVLLIAATSADPIYGALVMLAFGAGTTPAMLATGLGAARLSQWSRNRRNRVALGALVVVLGAITLSMPASRLLPGSPDHGGHQHGMQHTPS